MNKPKTEIMNKIYQPLLKWSQEAGRKYKLPKLEILAISYAAVTIKAEEI